MRGRRRVFDKATMFEGWVGAKMLAKSDGGRGVKVGLSLL
jgi:hypothetical protein